MYKIGIIGAGGISEKHIKACINNSKAINRVVLHLLWE